MGAVFLAAHLFIRGKEMKKQSVKEKPNTQSPSGVVHRVGYIFTRKDGTKAVNTECNHRNYFKNSANGYEHDWPLTDKPVTCKRCLSIIMVKREVRPRCDKCKVLGVKEIGFNCHGKNLNNEKCSKFLPENWEDMDYINGKWYIKREW